MVYCKECGKKNESGKYCKYCGKALNTQNILPFVIGIAIFFIIVIIFIVISFKSDINQDSLTGNTKKGIYLLLGKEFCGNKKCSETEIYECKKDCVWCGDGTCQQDEIGICFKDCEWCGDGYCQTNENCNDCSKDCGKCQSTYCGDGICNPGECQNGCTKDCSLTQCEDGKCEPVKGENCVTAPNDCKCKYNERCNQQQKYCEQITCGNNVCENGETISNCPNDCKETYQTTLTDPNSNYPIIFVHGHSPSEVNEYYSPLAFQEFQNKLKEEGYENMGLILPNDYPPKLTKGIWSGKKVSILTTYYANRYDSLGGIVGDSDNQHIDVYSQRLSDVVEVIKHNTGKNKVIIIAHSMGGLVSRNYIKNHGGLNSVDKLVTVGTPNHGTYGIISFGCGTLLAGRNPTPECQDMESNSSFILNLNSGDETPGDIRYLTIIGKNKKWGDCPNGEYWDNTICASSVYLVGAENYYYEDYSDKYYSKNLITWESNPLHTAMTKPSECPEVYKKIVSFVKE